MTIKQSMHDILEHEAKALLSIPYSEDYDRAIELIIEHVHRRGGKLVASGMGKAGQVALNIATTFSSTGTPGVFLHPGEAQHGDIGVLQPNDVMLLISNSGTTREMLDLVALTKDLHPEIPVIAMTGNLVTERRDVDIGFQTMNSVFLGRFEIVDGWSCRNSACR